MRGWSTLKQATIRREIVIQPVRMHRDAKRPDYQRGSLKDIELRARELAPTEDPNEPMIPPEVIDLLPSLERDDADGPFAGVDKAVDKAATPADRPVQTTAEKVRDMDRARPQVLVPQRDSDAGKDVEGSRANAFAQCSTLSLRTGSILEKQFEASYLPRVFNITLPWCVGGPDFRRRSHGVSERAVLKLLLAPGLH